jgi:hypothetical protein
MPEAGWQIDYWHWWVLAVALLILEAFAPGFVFLWLGISAGVVGLLLLIAPGIAWEYQVIAFAVLSVTAIAGWRRYQSRHPTHTDRPTLNRRAEQYVGRRFTLSSPIVNGRGTIQVDDSTWRVEGPDCEAGSTVEVLACDGTILKVEPKQG